MLTLQSDTTIIEKAEILEPSSASQKLNFVMYRLKGGYKLELYPSDGNQTYNVKLIGHGIDSVIMQRSTSWRKYIEHYDNVDFDDYFIVTSYRNHYLFKKKNGEMVHEMVWYSASLNHNLLLYDGTTILNLKNWKEVQIDLYKPKTVPEMYAVNAYLNYYISKVTDKEVIIIFKSSEHIIEIRVPISELE